jgi:hypothetical protein
VRAGERAVVEEALVPVLVPVLVLALTGVAGGAIWTWWADPPGKSDATPSNVELLLGRQFDVDGRYAITGLLLGLAVGSALAWVLRHRGWWLVLGVGAGAGAAAAVSYGFGLVWGPGPGEGMKRGALLSGAMAVHAPGVFLAWPIGALSGLMLVVWLADRAGDLAAEPALPELPPAR